MKTRASTVSNRFSNGLSACATGFTLIEVLVALAITSIALVAGLRAAMALSDNSQRQATALLANMCADNVLVALRLSRVMPPIGNSTLACSQAERNFTLQVSVQSTANLDFRRIDIKAVEGTEPVARLWTLMSRY